MGSGPRYSKIPAAAVTDGRLEHAAFRVLAYLGIHADANGEGFPSVGLIARKLGIGPRTVQRHLRNLKQLGCIKVKARFDQHGSQTSSMYYILYPDGGDIGCQGADTESHRPPDRGSRTSPDKGRHPNIPIQRPIETNSNSDMRGNERPLGRMLVRIATIETAKTILGDLDVSVAERNWRDWSKGKIVRDPDAAFLGFCRSHAKRNHKGG